MEREKGTYLAHHNVARLQLKGRHDVGDEDGEEKGSADFEREKLRRAGEPALASPSPPLQYRL